MTKPKTTKTAKTRPKESPEKRQPDPNEPTGEKVTRNNTGANEKTGANEPGDEKPRAKRPRARKPTKFEEAFDRWMSFMDDVLEELMRRVPDEVRRKLDYSAASLDVLEAWLLERYPDPDGTRYEADPEVFDMAARYIGETFRKTLGGRWWVDPKGKILRGRPHVGRFRSAPYSLCPLLDATALTFRRTGHFLRDLWQRRISWIAGRANLHPLLDDPQFRKHNKVTSEEEEFRHWLTMMDRAQDELVAELPEALRDRFDYSPGSLDVLEAWLLARYPDGEAARADTEVLTMDGAARYVGETFRRNLGGAWWFDLEGWSHNALPQIRWPKPANAAQEGEAMPSGDASDDVAPPVCPLILAREAIEARRGDMLADAFRARRDALDA